MSCCRAASHAGSFIALPPPVTVPGARRFGAAALAESAFAHERAGVSMPTPQAGCRADVPALTRASAPSSLLPCLDTPPRIVAHGVMPTPPMTPLLTARLSCLCWLSGSLTGRPSPRLTLAPPRRDARKMSTAQDRSAHHGIRNAVEEVQGPARAAMGTHRNQIALAFLGYAANLGGGIAPRRGCAPGPRCGARGRVTIGPRSPAAGPPCQAPPDRAGHAREESGPARARPE